MIVVKTVEDFKKHNDADLQSFFIYKTGIIDKDLRDETLQEFYVKLIETKALETFDPNKATNPVAERGFETYIMNLFCWSLPIIKKKNVKMELKSIGDNKYIKMKIPHITDISRDDKRVNIWDILTTDGSSNLSLDSSYNSSLTEFQKEEEMNKSIEDLIKYIKKTERKKKSDKMELFIRRKMEGCKSMDIALMLGVSNTMIRILKVDVYKKYQFWKNLGS